MGQVKGNGLVRIDNHNATKPVMIDCDVRHAEGILSWGSFSDTTTQSASLADIAYPMKFNTIEGSKGFTIVNDSNGFPTRIKALQTGVYNLQFSSQFENTANTNIDINVWLDYTGSNVPRSGGHVSLTKVSGQFANVIAAWNYVLPIQQLDYVQLKWSSTANTATMFYSGSNGIRPETPSVIATITQVG